jgi:hypothetical protein
MLFNDAVSAAANIKCNMVRIIALGEIVRIEEEAAVDYLGHQWYYPGIHLQRLRKTTTKLCQDDWHSKQDSNKRPTEYKSDVNRLARSLLA